MWEFLRKRAVLLANFRRFDFFLAVLYRFGKTILPYSGPYLEGLEPIRSGENGGGGGEGEGGAGRRDGKGLS